VNIRTDNWEGSKAKIDTRSGKKGGKTIVKTGDESCGKCGKQGKQIIIRRRGDRQDGGDEKLCGCGCMQVEGAID
jgi:hypothetical protein